MKRSAVRRSLAFSLIFCAALLLAACAPAAQTQAPSGAAVSAPNVTKTEKGQYTNLTVTELQAMLEHKDFTFVNVHIPFQGSIAGPDKFIPYDTIDQHLDQLPADKNAKIVLYCRSDHMSNIAAHTLANLGYTNLYQLVGGFDAWKAAGLPLQMNQ